MQLRGLVYHDKLSMVNETYQWPTAGGMELLIRDRADVFLDLVEKGLKASALRAGCQSLKWDLGRWEWDNQIFVFNKTFI